MKKRYLELLSIFGAEILICAILSANGVRVESEILNAIGTLLVLAPLLILFYLLGNDERFSEGKRLCFKIVFWFLIISYVLGAVATFVEL